MGEDLTLFTAGFNRSVRVETRQERLSSDAGVLVLRELLERLGIVPWLVEHLRDNRASELVTHPLSELLRTSLLLLAQGWRDQDDADTLRHDPMLRLSVSDRRGTSPLEPSPPGTPNGLPSQPTLSRLVDMLASEHNRGVLRRALTEMAGRRFRATRGGHRQRQLTIDIDSLPNEVHGHQPGSQYNGHYHVRMYHPLVATCAGLGDLLDAQLRPGNVYTADGAVDFVIPMLDVVEDTLCQRAAVRIDAGFPDEELLSRLEARGTPYVARLKNNKALDRLAEPFLRRPVGRPTSEPRMWLCEARYRAGSWSRDRRVVLVVQERPGELLPHYFWLVTNWPADEVLDRELLEHYRERGTAEGHLGELMNVLHPALSSSPRPKTHYRGSAPKQAKKPRPPVDCFAHNEVLLLLNALAYNLMHAARTLLATETQKGWSLSRVRERLLRVAARVLVHGRRVTVVIAQAATELWQKLYVSLWRLRLDGS